MDRVCVSQRGLPGRGPPPAYCFLLYCITPFHRRRCVRWRDRSLRFSRLKYMPPSINGGRRLAGRERFSSVEQSEEEAVPATVARFLEGEALLYQGRPESGRGHWPSVRELDTTWHVALSYGLMQVLTEHEFLGEYHHCGIDRDTAQHTLEKCLERTAPCLGRRNRTDFCCRPSSRQLLTAKRNGKRQLPSARTLSRRKNSGSASWNRQ